jgi:hypothetical protein
MRIEPLYASALPACLPSSSAKRAATTGQL